MDLELNGQVSHVEDEQQHHDDYDYVTQQHDIDGEMHEFVDGHHEHNDDMDVVVDDEHGPVDHQSGEDLFTDYEQEFNEASDLSAHEDDEHDHEK